MTKRLLLVQLVPNDFIYTYYYSGLEEYRRKILEVHPTMEKWMPDQIFKREPLWPQKMMYNLWDYGANTVGEFIASNLDTPTTVLHGKITSRKVLQKLQQGKEQGFPYTHVGFSTFVSTHSLFVEIIEAVRTFDNNIITIVGGVGAFFEEKNSTVADHICRTDGIPFLRNLLGENNDRPYTSVLVPNKLSIKLCDLNFKIDTAMFVSKLGCPMFCDFCPTSHLFNGKCSQPFFTPQQVHDMMVEYRRTLKRDFQTIFCEPTMITNKKWWYELFDLFKGEPGDYAVMGATTIPSLLKFDFDRISDSSMRFDFFNIGIESFSKNYSKNQKHKDTRTVIKLLDDHGIISVATFIIGFDHQTHKSVWEEVHQLTDMGATNNMVLNLKVMPLPDHNGVESLWNKLKRENRLLDVPIDFYYLLGFQAFLHPHFKPGFTDMLPLLLDIYEYLDKEVGPMPLRYGDILSNVPRKSKGLEKKIDMNRMIAKLLYPSWEKYLNPTLEQDHRYLSKLIDAPHIPEVFAQAVESFSN
jgi:hypothetical protein